MKPNNASENANEHNMGKNPTGWRQTSLFRFTSMSKELNQGLQRNNSHQWSEQDFNLWPLDYKIFWHSSHLGQVASYRFDFKCLLIILNHADKALRMDWVWAWQDLGPNEHILK